MKEKNTTKENIVDATGKTLGRVATEIAHVLMGKNKPTFERNAYSGSGVLVLNASKIRITPKKLEEINHKRYSGYRGGLKIMDANFTIATKGHKELVRLAVYHMLPGNKLRREMLKHLKIEN